MVISIPNPYTGNDDETCSVSFAAQQKMAAGVSSPQTEAEYHKSKLLGEWGVVKAKLAKGDIPSGTKVLTYTNASIGSRGYLYVKAGQLQKRTYTSKGLKTDSPIDPDKAELFINSGLYQTSIPQVAGVVAPTPSSPVNSGSDSVGSMSNEDVAAMFVKIKDDLAKEQGLNIKGANPQLDQLVFAKIGEKTGYTGAEVKAKIDAYKADGNKLSALKKKVLAGTYKPTVIAKDPPKVGTPPLPHPEPFSPPSVAKPTKAEALAKLKGLGESNKYVTGGTQALGLKPAGADGLGQNKMIDAISEALGVPKSSLPDLINKHGYEQTVDMATTTVYTAQDWVFAAVVKKYINNPGEGVVVAVRRNGKLVVIDGNHRAAAANLLGDPVKMKVIDLDNLKPAPGKDNQPNGVPTVATNKLADEVKVEVQQEVAKEPNKGYSDEDVAAAYIIAKDAIVASNTKGWTLYTKNEEFDLEIAIQVGLKTGLNPGQQKVAIANYLASGKKLSTLKKQLAKQGAFTPQADSLKKSGAAKNQADKAKEAEAKADAGYTPTPTPSSAVSPPLGKKPMISDFKDKGGVAAWQKAIKEWNASQKNTEEAKVNTDTGKEAPRAVRDKAEESGDISGISDQLKKFYFDKFKAKAHLSYLSSSTTQNYEAFASTLAEMKLLGHSKNLTMLQLVRVVDEYGAQKAGVDNGKLFEKKVVTWLTTPEGTSYIKANQDKLAKQAEEKAKAAKLKAEIEAAAKELEANQPPLPADSAIFQEMTPSKALDFQLQMLKARPFKAGEKSGIRHYTGSAYTAMNNHLRGLSTSISDTDKKHIEPAVRGMRPAPEPMLLRRGTGANQFLAFGVKRGETHMIWGLTGKTFEDKGFLSTSAAGRAAFGGEVALEIEAPAGTPMMYVDKLKEEDGTLSAFSKHPGENEMLLAPGLKYKILNVRTSGSTLVVRVRIVDWPGKAS